MIISEFTDTEKLRYIDIVLSVQQLDNIAILEWHIWIVTSWCVLVAQISFHCGSNQSRTNTEGAKKAQYNTILELMPVNLNIKDYFSRQGQTKTFDSRFHHGDIVIDLQPYDEEGSV